eukprot:TRINITY_DN71014_c0_g1_i1.p1 TRINITY_DN71014_c0_g1~~TRINITY_DN71014_c0_g1_i1.p1  ORF type:complete len:170 (-),score=11.14 TRINITY_DN71014_c0_g1_i1:15-524(-)
MLRNRYTLSLQCLIQLVAENRAETDRVGGSPFYWSFPATRVAKDEEMCRKLESDVASARAAISTLKTELAEATVGKEDTAERRGLIEEVSSLKAQLADLTTHMQAAEDLSPAVVEEMVAMRHSCDFLSNTTVDLACGLLDFAARASPSPDLGKLAFALGLTEADFFYIE